MLGRHIRLSNSARDLLSEHRELHVEQQGKGQTACCPLRSCGDHAVPMRVTTQDMHCAYPVRADIVHTVPVVTSRAGRSFQAISKCDVMQEVEGVEVVL